MKEGKVFVDTNMLVYAYDETAGRKHELAYKLMVELWMSGRGVISTQVLQEFFVTVTRKIERPMEAVKVKGIIEDYLKWKTVIVNGATILEAIEIHRSYKYSFWDSLIIASAIEGEVATLISEDFSDRHKIKGVTIKNPFII